MKELSLTEKKKNASMKRILKDALHYFEKNGYDNTSIEVLCEEAMISKSSFFNYFGSKENIIAMITEEGLEEYKNYSASRLDSDEPWQDILRDVIRFQIHETAKYKNISKVFYRLCFQMENHARLKKSGDEYTAELLQQLLAKNNVQLKLDSLTVAQFIGSFFTNTIMTESAEKWEEEVMMQLDSMLSVVNV